MSINHRFFRNSYRFSFSLLFLFAFIVGPIVLTTANAQGVVRAWGWNQYGQLGDGTTQNRNIAVKTLEAGSSLPFTNCIAISGAWGHTVALKSDGTVWTYGSNQFGQLGDGTLTDHLNPIQVFTTRHF